MKDKELLDEWIDTLTKVIDLLSAPADTGISSLDKKISAIGKDLVCIKNLFKKLQHKEN